MTRLTMERLSGVDDPRLPAAVKLLGHTGAAEFQIRYCEEERPIIWMACARWGRRWEAAAALTPLAAVFRLCDQVIDGGQCTHCQRPTGFDPDELGRVPIASLVCWYRWNPRKSEFQRGCLGREP